MYRRIIVPFRHYRREDTFGVQVATFLHDFQREVPHVLVTVLHLFQSLDRSVYAFRDPDRYPVLEVVPELRSIHQVLRVLYQILGLCLPRPLVGLRHHDSRRRLVLTFEHPVEVLYDDLHQRNLLVSSHDFLDVDPLVLRLHPVPVMLVA